MVLQMFCDMTQKYFFVPRTNGIMLPFLHEIANLPIGQLLLPITNHGTQIFVIQDIHSITYHCKLTYRKLSCKNWGPKEVQDHVMFRINFNRKISLTQVISKSLLRLMRGAGGASTARLDGATAASICRTQNPKVSGNAKYHHKS